MNRLQDLPIRQKMLVMTLLICGAVLVFAIGALFTFQVVNFGSNFKSNTTALAAIIADQCSLFVSQDAFFADKTEYLKESETALAVLKANPRVLTASLVLPDGRLLANYPTNTIADYPTNTIANYPANAPGESEFSREYLWRIQPVVLKGERQGYLYLRADYWVPFWDLVRLYGQVIAGVFLVSISLAVFLSSRLGRTITQPVLQLAQTAKIVGEKKDYSVRAVVTSRGDELGRLAESFNEMLSRIESQDAALSLSQQKMEALIHSIDGIVWERAPDTFRFTFISRQSDDILGYAPQAWLDQPDFWEQKLHPQDAAKAIQTSHEMATRGQPYSYEYRMIAADGRTVWIRESGMVLVEKGRPVAMRGIFLDITQHKLDAEELDKLNQQLIDTSRHAGMADVATGVLHNVGNVLNSVSVSATLVADRLRRSRVAKLQRASAMLRAGNGNLAGFLTTDPKGKLIPEYLVTVADQLATEQTDLIEEMDAVGQHIEHIKEIVAMQQSYAKVSGVYENLPPAELVEDALRLNLAAFERHHIELVRQFDKSTPAVFVDRHKVLQILINLLRNAKHAMEVVHERERRMVIGIGLTSPDRVKIVVSDNGIGISPDHLTKIFNHGFTTKKDGHGFGLHSGANAAREMGGSLTGRSDGSGQGAEFTLELPTSVATRTNECLKQINV